MATKEEKKRQRADEAQVQIGNELHRIREQLEISNQLMALSMLASMGQISASNASEVTEAIVKRLGLRLVDNDTEPDNA